jgi:hypothetical protein
VDGGQPLGLPLLDEHAEGLAQSMEIDVERIAFQNPAWPVFVNRLAKDVARKLGVDSEATVSVKLSKNHLHVPGATFKAHDEYVNSRVHHGT